MKVEVIHIHVLYEREQWTRRRGLKRDFSRVSVPLTAVTNSECCPRKAEMNSKALRYHSHLLEAASPSVKLSQSYPQCRPPVRIRYAHANEESRAEYSVTEDAQDVVSTVFAIRNLDQFITRYLCSNVSTQKVGMLVPLQHPSSKAHLGQLLAHRSATHEPGSTEHGAI